MTQEIVKRPFVSNSLKQSASDFGNVYHFTARRFDDMTGLYYYRNRYYEPRSGRFVSRDPAGYIDTMNLYTHAANNLLNALDPFGLDFKYLGWKWQRPKGGGSGRTLAFYGIALECYCKKGTYYLRFKEAYVRMRIIINPSFKKDYKAIQEGTLKDGGGTAVSKTQLSYTDKRGNTVNTPYGICGHERRHVKSVKAAYDKALKAGGILRNEIERMEKIPLTTQKNCEKELEIRPAKEGRQETWMTQLLVVLKSVIDQGAGHDKVDATTRPEGGRPYAPDKKMETPKSKFEKLPKGYIRYPLPE